MNHHLARTALATIRQTTGRQYPHLEPLLDTMTVEQLQDVIRLMRDLEDGAKRQVRSRASWMNSAI